jgi:hypothetical protein
LSVVLAATLLGGCSAEERGAPESRQEAAGAAPVEAAPLPDGVPPPPPPPPPAPSAFPGLMPLGEAQVAAALGTGARCALSDGGAPLMAAVPGAAVINDGGRMVRLTASARDWSALREGGTFRGGGVELEVDAGAVVGGEGETAVRDASTWIRRGRRGMGTSHGPRWTCGG